MGVVLALSGLVLAGYVGWQLFGTTWVSKRQQAAVAEELRGSWRQGEATVAVDQGTARALVRIPAFGSDFAVPVFDGTADDALAAGIGHFAGTAGPGQRGNYALAGHRVTRGEPFRNLPDLEVGDRILVDTAEATYTYELVTSGDALTVPSSAGWVLDRLPANPDPGGVQPLQRPGSRLLTLVTCSELFRTDGRLVAFAKLVGTAVRS
ncbi:class E sortase [Nocardioides hungaricus]